MKQYKIIRELGLFFHLIWLEFKIFLVNAKMFLRSRSRLLWNKLYIRKDEFHSSLDLDGEALQTMNEEQGKKYQLDLVRRRNIAHKKDLEGEEGLKLRRELLILLNKDERIKATAIIDKFSRDNGMTCTRFMVPKSPSLFTRMDYALVVFLNGLQLSFTYSGLIAPQWKNSW